jgi:hypothetical protein
LTARTVEISMNRIIAAGALVAAVAAFAADPLETTLTSEKKVAVVSLLGDQFHGIRVGTTVFGNLEYEADVSEWNIDQFAEQLLASHFRDAHSLAVVPLNLDATERKRFARSESAFMGYDYDRIFELARAQGFDVLALVKPVKYQNAPFFKPGYGFYEKTFMGSERRCVYTLFIVDFRSVASQAEMGWEWGKPCQGGERELQWREKFGDFTESEKVLLRQRVEESLRGAMLPAASEAYRRAALPPR